MKVHMARVRYGKILTMIYFKGHNGQWYFDSNKPQRFLVFLYGLPSHPFDEHTPMVKKFLKEDFIIVCPEYIGTFSSYGECNLQNSIDTALQTIKFLKKGRGKNLWDLTEFQWRVKDITLIGGSYGGSVALVAGAKSKDIKNIVAISSPIDWKTHSRMLEEKEDIYELYNIVRRGFENVWRISSKEDWDKFAKGELDMNPIDYIDSLKNKNVLIIHGAKDQVVNVKRAHELYEKLKNGKGKCKKIILPKEKHIGLRIFEKPKIFDQFVSWLEDLKSNV